MADPADELAGRLRRRPASNPADTQGQKGAICATSPSPVGEARRLTIIAGYITRADTTDSALIQEAAACEVIFLLLVGRHTEMPNELTEPMRSAESLMRANELGLCRKLETSSEYDFVERFGFSTVESQHYLTGKGFDGPPGHQDDCSNT